MVFAPKFWSKERKILSIVLLATNIIVFYAVFSKAYEVYLDVGLVPQLRTILFWTVTFFGLTWLVAGLSSWWTVKHEKIEVVDGFLKSTSQEMLRSPIFTAVKLSTVKTVKDRAEKRVVPTGKSVMVIVVYHLIFEHENGEKQEISMVGWDKGSVKEMLMYVNEMYPKIFIQTYAFRESSEKILSEYLPLIRKK